MKKLHHTLIEWYFITGFDGIVNDSDERTRYCFSTARFIKMAILTGLGHLVWLHNIQHFTFNSKPLSNQTFHGTLLYVSVCGCERERQNVIWSLKERPLSLSDLSKSITLKNVWWYHSQPCFFFLLQMLKLFPNGCEIGKLNIKLFECVIVKRHETEISIMERCDPNTMIAVMRYC